MTVELQTALSVSLPHAQPLLDRVIRELALDARSIPPAHLTLLFPWMPPESVTDAVLGELRAFFADLPPLDMSLDVGWFGREVLLLVPSQPEPLVELTQAIIDRWPEFPYYGGDYDSIDPHVTLAYGDERTLAPVAEAVASMAPLQVTTNCVELTQGVEMAVRASFPLRREAGARLTSIPPSVARP